MTKEEQLILSKAYTAKDHPIEEFRCVEITKDSNHYHAANNLVAKGYLTTLFTENFFIITDNGIKCWGSKCLS